MTTKRNEEPLHIDVDGKLLRVTHLSKVLFPDEGITKAEVMRYYSDTAPNLLPHIRGRPLTLKAFPHGISGRPYYRRQLGAGTPSWLSRIELEHGPAPVVEDMADLLWVVNQDSIELHPWLARRDDLGHPDQLIFDLDPGVQTPFQRTCEAALVVKSTLDEFGIESWPKTTGSKGLHVTVGISPEYEFDDVRAWVLGVARVLAQHRPDLFTVGYSRRDRIGKVLIDYNQVGYGRTTASIYSVRPLSNAPVSAPLTWGEVESGEIVPDQFTIRTMPERLTSLGDVASGLVDSYQKLPHL